MLKTEIHTTILFLVCLLAFSCGSDDRTMSETDKRLYELLSEKQYFRLRDEFATAERLPEIRRLYYKAYLENVFNNKESSNEQITALLNKHGAELPDSTKVELLELRATNEVFLHNYSGAADTYREMLDKYSDSMDSTLTADMKNNLALWGALSGAGPQRLHAHGDIRIPSARDSYNYIIAPVACNGVESGFIFDTGANLSTIPEHMAVKMGMDIFEAEISVGTGTSIVVKSSLAVAENFKVDELEFENVRFLVIPDEALMLGDYAINGILGIPLMIQMGEVHIEREGGIYVPARPTDREFRNLCFDNFFPVVEMFSGTDTLTIVFDSGASSTDLSERYFQKHADAILDNATYVERQRGGAGGIVTSKEYHLKDFPFTIGSASSVLQTVSISQDNDEALNLQFDGNLGQDIIMQFDKMILNFRHMFIDFE